MRKSAQATFLGVGIGIGIGIEIDTFRPCPPLSRPDSDTDTDPDQGSGSVVQRCPSLGDRCFLFHHLGHWFVWDSGAPRFQSSPSFLGQ
jgi:hypothetical protein